MPFSAEAIEGKYETAAAHVVRHGTGDRGRWIAVNGNDDYEDLVAKLTDDPKVRPVMVVSFEGRRSATKLESGVFEMRFGPKRADGMHSLRSVHWVP